MKKGQGPRSSSILAVLDLLICSLNHIATTAPEMQIAASRESGLTFRPPYSETFLETLFHLFQATRMQKEPAHSVTVPWPSEKVD